MDLTANTRVIAIAGLVVAVVGAAAVFALGDRGPSHPDTWDPSVTELVGFVESTRGLPFLHPVSVDPLDDDAFVVAVGAGEQVGGVDRQRAVEMVALLRALGLVTASVDDEELAETAVRETLTDRAVAYLPGAERIVVRTDDLDDLDELERAGLVAALGHALHHQHAGESGGTPFERDPRVAGRRAVATGVGAALAVRHLTDRDEDPRTWRDARAGGANSRPVDLLHALARLPDHLGEPLVEVALVDVTPGEGTSWSAVRGLSTSPPRTELEVLQPWAAIDGFERVGVRSPEVPEDHEVIAEGSFGAATLYFVTALRIDPREALAAALEWAGDAYVLTRDRDGRACVHLSVTGGDGDASDRIAGVLDGWIDSGPRGAASLERDGRVLTLRSCDPGPGAPDGIELDPATVVRVPVSRTDLLAELRGSGASRAQAVCIADRVLAAIPVTALTDPDPPPEADTLYEILREESQQACRRL